MQSYVRDVFVLTSVQMDEFMPHVPLIQRLCNPGMRDRHWAEISSQLGMQLKPDDTFTLTTLLKIEFTPDQVEIIAKVSDVAGKEYSIEQALDKMEGEWRDVALEVIDYKYASLLCLLWTLF